MRKVKKPKIGSYVFVSKYSDKSPADPWAVGFLCNYLVTKNYIRYRIDGNTRGYNHCWLITQEEGKKIIDGHKQAMKECGEEIYLPADLFKRLIKE